MPTGLRKLHGQELWPKNPKEKTRDALKSQNEINARGEAKKVNRTQMNADFQDKD